MARDIFPVDPESKRQSQDRASISERRKAAALATGVKRLDFSDGAEFEANYYLKNTPIGRLKSRRNGYVFGARLTGFQQLPKHIRHDANACRPKAILTEQEQQALRAVKRDMAMGLDAFGDDE